MNYERIDESKQFDGAVRNSHEARYHLASGFIADDDSIIDAGCGVGYGMPILLTPARVEAGATYLGLDKNPVGEPELFQKADFEKGEYENEPENFDVFVGFEIIEHLDPVGHFINLAKKAKQHVEAVEFAKLFSKGKLDGVLFDPPYSFRQISEHYKILGKKATAKDTSMVFYEKVKSAICDAVRPGGYAITFGWNTNGFGVTRGFRIVEIMTIAHGGSKNDTIVVVEKKI